MKKLLFFSLLLLMACQSKTVKKLSDGGKINLIPQPQSIQYHNTAGFLLDSNVEVYYKGPLSEEAQLLVEYLQQGGIEAKASTGSPKGKHIALQLLSPSNDSSEAYQLDADAKQLRIEAPSRLGILHGIQSLRQILLQSNLVDGALQIPACRIKDAPRFRWRGLLLDCGRHFLDKTFIKRYIDLLALHKMNRLHWHLTDDQGWRIEIKKYPKLTEIGAWRNDGKGGRYGGFYTQADIKEVVEYARLRGIVVVPEIELPGHAQAALASYPQYSCSGGPFEVETEWGVFKEIYCAGNDSTFHFLEDVLTEVLELFPSPYIHIGGDEAPKYRWEHCSKCQKRIAAEGLKDEHELQSYFIGRINRFLQSKGRQLIGWDEILEGGLSSGAVVQSWRGFEGAKTAVQQGNAAIVSPTSHAYFDYGLNDIDLEKVYHFNPIPEGLSDQEAQRIWGGECNMWSERAPQEKVDSKVFPRILAMAEVLWTGPEHKDIADFNRRVLQHYPCLDRLGVAYGLARLPLKMETEVEGQALLVRLMATDSSLETYYRRGAAGEKLRYSAALRFAQPDTLLISFERKGKAFDFDIQQVFLPHLAMGLQPQVAHEIHENYSAGGPKGLCDGKKGSNNFKDGNWQGCWGCSAAEALIDLGKEQSLTALSAGFLQYNNAWIFFPEKVEFFYSLDGKAYQLAGILHNKISPKEKEQMTQEFSLTLNKIKARYIKIKASSIGHCPDWHDAAGSKSWIFIDEIAVK